MTLRRILGYCVGDLDAMITENERVRLVPELPRGWVPPFRQASSGVSSHVIDSAVPANWIGDDTVEVSEFLAGLLNAVYPPRLPREQE